MKKTVTDKLQRIEFFVYFIFMILFGFFLTYYSLALKFISIIFPIAAMTVSTLSIIILINYYKNVMLVERLLPIFISLLVFLLIGSSAAEAIRFGFHPYVLVMKGSLYLFCLWTPVKLLIQLNHKIREWNKQCQVGSK